VISTISPTFRVFRSIASTFAVIVTLSPTVVQRGTAPMHAMVSPFWHRRCISVPRSAVVIASLLGGSTCLGSGTLTAYGNTTWELVGADKLAAAAAESRVLERETAWPIVGDPHGRAGFPEQEPPSVTRNNTTVRRESQFQRTREDSYVGGGMKKENSSGGRAE
jgi:hypothetical protein